MESYRLQSRDAIERVGITIWKIAVLAIGLHCTLIMIRQQGYIDGLVIGSALLQAIALVLLTLGIALAAANYARGHWHWPRRAWLVPEPAHRRQRAAGATQYASQRLLAAQSNPRLVSGGSEWMLALGLDAMLAAQIIQVSMAYVGQNELNWWRIGVLAIIALSRILF